MLAGASGATKIKKMSATERFIRKQFAIWSLAWSEFGQKHSLMKRVPGLLAAIVFTVLGQSVLGLLALLHVVAPWFVWALTFFASTTLAELFVIHYSGIAYERTQRETTERLEDRIWLLEDKLQPKLRIVFEPKKDPYDAELRGCQAVSSRSD